MKLAIMQPYFMPYIGYFQLIAAVDKFVIFDDVNYIKKGWINRNNILVNGKNFLFTMTLENVSQNKQINQIIIDDNKSWKVDLLKTIELAYKKSPYFNDVLQIIKDILYYDENNLSEFLQYSLQYLCRFLNIKTKIVVSSTIEKNNDLKGQDKIIDICKKLGGTNYINAIGGKDLYDKQAFLDNNIELNFIRTNPIIYKQLKNDFIPWLSIIDVMMFNSKEAIQKQLNLYDLV